MNAEAEVLAIALAALVSHDLAQDEREGMAPCSEVQAAVNVLYGMRGGFESEQLASECEILRTRCDAAFESGR